MLVVSRLLSSSISCSSRTKYRLKSISSQMGSENLLPEKRKQATLRLCNVSSHMTELLELRAEDPLINILLIPGNPGIISFYKDFVEAVYELLGGKASITAIGHISQTRKNWEGGRLFSLNEQINHKVDFIKNELQYAEIPLLLVSHSIGSYISLEIFRRLPEQVKYCIGLYPFLSLNKESAKQSLIGKIVVSQIFSFLVSSTAAVFGLFPSWASRFLVRRSIGKSWSATAVEAGCNYLLQYHVMRNVLFMAMTEFDKLSEAPDWRFIRGKWDQIAFLFGHDDHWGPLSMSEEITKQVPDVALTIEREGHTHAFCCSEAGSLWVAYHVVSLINRQILIASQ
uniref:Lipid droplet-associated hydrolase n=1 Tax=Nelumbo nucifera TaxID=4432 RepID=A0A823A2W7_NELNU|nr:TPA_asm: hypothetical protein HUJ06_018365 [Nelumbo nucifera]